MNIILTFLLISSIFLFNPYKKYLKKKRVKLDQIISSYATIILVLISALYGYTTNQTIRLMEESNRVESRPYLAIMPGKNIKRPPSGIPFIILDEDANIISAKKPNTPTGEIFYFVITNISSHLAIIEEVSFVIRRENQTILKAPDEFMLLSLPPNGSLPRTTEYAGELFFKPGGPHLLDLEITIFYRDVQTPSNLYKFKHISEYKIQDGKLLSSQIIRQSDLLVPSKFKEKA